MSKDYCKNRPSALKGALSENKIFAYDPKQLEMGVKVEMEHTKNKEVALCIALDHIIEFPDYYTRLHKMEKEAEKFWTPTRRKEFNKTKKLPKK